MNPSRISPSCDPAPVWRWQPEARVDRRRSSTTPLRALVCDDEAPLCGLMARRVEKLGLQGDKAQDGQAGLALIGSSKDALIVTDIYMPGVTGLELLEAAKTRAGDIQVIIVTRLVASTLRERVANQLLESSRVAADGIVRSQTALPSKV